MTAVWSRALRAILACSVLAGCDGGQKSAEDAARAQDIEALDSIAGDSLFMPNERRRELPTDRIYYTLTSHEWYARGEPLVHDGRAHMPHGLPVEVSLTEMDRVGEFKGVDYYVRENDAESAVYVPVFPGYWQMFRASGAVVAGPDEAGEPPADDDPDGGPDASVVNDTLAVRD